MHSGFKDLLCEVNAYRVEYLKVGAYALAAHGHARATKDIDIWIRPNPDNAKRVVGAITAFGAPLHVTTPQDLTGPDFVSQIGVAPDCIDIITTIKGVSFEQAWPARMITTFCGESVGVLSRKRLIQSKTASDRPQDIADFHCLNQNPPKK